MLYQELPRIDSTPLDGWGRWLAPALIIGAALTFAILLVLLSQPLLGALLALGGVAFATMVFSRSPLRLSTNEPLVMGPDFSLVGSALGLCHDACALTTSEGSLLVANRAYREQFGGSRTPLDLGADDQAREGLELARS